MLVQKYRRKNESIPSTATAALLAKCFTLLRRPVYTQIDY